MGISVKSRSRNDGKDGQYVAIVTKDQFAKMHEACRDFSAIPWFAVLVDSGDVTRLFMTSYEHMAELFPPSETRISFKVNDKWLNNHRNDDQMIFYETKNKVINWWGKSSDPD